MISREGLRTIGVTGLMRGIIVSFLPLFTCILPSMFGRARYAFPALIWTNLFHSILPALAFSLDMFDKTDQSYGVNEVLLASVLGAVVFSLFAAQPLVIVGVTGESSGCLASWFIDRSLQARLLSSTTRYTT